MLGGGTGRHVRSLVVDEGHIACFPPFQQAGDAELMLERFTDEGRQARGMIRLLPLRPDPLPRRPQSGTALLTNGIGGMCRLQVDLGSIRSKYDCLLGANLHPSAPSDRHILAKRVRIWINADGFTTPLDASALASFSDGPPARWTFVAPAGDGHCAQIELSVCMLAESNTVVMQLHRPAAPPLWGTDLGEGREVRLIVRVDLEDRSFHQETRRGTDSDRHFAGNTRELEGRPGFLFAPNPNAACRSIPSAGRFHAEAEWCQGIEHPLEAQRGLAASGDAWSPGWFELPMPREESVRLVVSADPQEPGPAAIQGAMDATSGMMQQALGKAGCAQDDHFASALAIAAQAYVVRRDQGRTVIAGYPWFLDWGRDTFIAARGLLSLGMRQEVEGILTTFARFASAGTVPNLRIGDDASNRDTSDAPLWFALACEELASAGGARIHDLDCGGRSLRQVLRAIACGYLDGTPNGIRVDPGSGLVWSPPHFTWMDTNHPAATPRAGYPIEIQVLWIRLLRQLGQLKVEAHGEPWWALADRATAALGRYWLEDRGYLADVLLCPAGTPAAAAMADNALRPNQLFAVSLGVIQGERARRATAAAMRFLLVPGGIRSLAPLPVSPPLPVHGPDGRLLNAPSEPYWGRYEGDEDTRRKPAYHNGTAWVWNLPVFCEALARAWNFSPAAISTASAYLGSLDRLLADGCIGQLPEILDGDAPHQSRGCDAQAWSVTEAIRVWKLLKQPPAPAAP